jgi:hypothetical protein
MAKNENTVNKGGTEEKPKEQEKTTADLSEKAAAPTDTDAKRTGITFIKGEGKEAGKAEGADLTAPKDGGKVTRIAFGKDNGEGGTVIPPDEAVKTGVKEQERTTAPKGRGGKLPKEKDGKPEPADKGENADKNGKVAAKEKKTRVARPPDGVKREKAINIDGAGDDKTPPVPEPPKEAPRTNEKEEIIQILHAELYPFKDHPFRVRDDQAMKNLVESVKERGVDQPLSVRERAAAMSLYRGTGGSGRASWRDIRAFPVRL